MPTEPDTDVADPQSALFANLDEIAADRERNPLLLGWFSLNDVLATLIVPALEKLAADSHGYPVGDGTGTQMFVLDADKAGDEKAAAWAETLRTIKRGFEAHLELSGVPDRDKIAELRETRTRGMQLFALHFEDIGD